MSRWLRKIRGAVLMGIIWALVWAPFGVLISFIVDPDGSMDEPWLLIGAYPGFLCGVIFSVVLGIAERNRGVDELPFRRVAAWGAIAGLALGLLPATLIEPDGAISKWLLGLAIAGPMTLLGAGSAAGSLALAKKGEARELPRQQ